MTVELAGRFEIQASKPRNNGIDRDTVRENVPAGITNITVSTG